MEFNIELLAQNSYDTQTCEIELRPIKILSSIVHEGKNSTFQQIFLERINLYRSLIMENYFSGDQNLAQNWMVAPGNSMEFNTELLAQNLPDHKHHQLMSRQSMFCPRFCNDKKLLLKSSISMKIS